MCGIVTNGRGAGPGCFGYGVDRAKTALLPRVVVFFLPEASRCSPSALPALPYTERAATLGLPKQKGLRYRHLLAVDDYFLHHLQAAMDETWRLI